MWTPPISEIALAVYAGSVFLLAVYAAHSLWLLARFARRRRAALAEVAREDERPLPGECPTVLVQLPVFNERDVVERLVEAAGALRWPRERLRIQLLDDGTDDSVALGAEAIERLRSRGVDACVLHRVDRVGFKAGALAAGLRLDAEHAGGPAELVAIFDADFVPAPDFLERASRPLRLDPDLALVQGRWEHLNRDASALTRAQALGIDGHFAIEQGARAWSGLAMNFNGTSGLFRRSAIEDAGGWEHDTLTEDLDLSYRIQLAPRAGGAPPWRCTYRADLAVPGEIPQTVSAWRAQQFRWAKGSLQTAKKLLPRVWRSAWPWHKKVAATLHMTHYLVHPLILANLVAAPLAMPTLHGLAAPWLALGVSLFALGVGAPVTLYVAAQFALRGKSAWRRAREVPVLAAIGTGIAVSNTRAVWEALRGRSSEFLRTPKQGPRRMSSYRAAGASGWVEAACAAWAVVGVALGLGGERPTMGLLLTLYATGFAYVALRLRREACLAMARAEEATGEAAVRPLPRGLLALGAVSVAGHAVLGGLPGSWREAPAAFTALALALGAVYLVGVWLVTRRMTGRVSGRGAAAIVGLAVAMRVAALPLMPSDDLNRYVVEGVQVAAGENPYAVSPADSVAARGLPDATRAGVNHPSWTAIYPPVTLGLEAVVTAISPTPMAFKVTALLVEILGLLAALALLRRLRESALLLVASAWHPLAPIFGAGEGHHDALLATLILVSVLAAVDGRRRLGLIVGSLAALVKPFGLVALAAQATLRRRETWALPAGVALLVYLPFIPAGLSLFQSLGRFGTEMRFHGALEPVVRGALELVASQGDAAALAPLLLAAAWVTASALLWRRGGRLGLTPPVLAAQLLTALLLCLPTLHPWYLLPLVALFPFYRPWVLLAWTALAPVYWLHGLAMADGAWAGLGWVTTLAHAPLIVWLWRPPGRGSRGRGAEEQGELTTGERMQAGAG